MDTAPLDIITATATEEATVTSTIASTEAATEGLTVDTSICRSDSAVQVCPPQQRYNLRSRQWLQAPDRFTPSLANGYSDADLMMQDDMASTTSDTSASICSSPEADGFVLGDETTEDGDYIPGATSSDEDAELCSLVDETEDHDHTELV